MKKSKVIIPAMALILFSTAASISGTVAWFTANRAVNFTTGQFALVNVDGNLDLTLTAGVGTAISGTQVNPYSTEHELSDASFNPVSKLLWNDDGTGTRFVTLGTNTTYQSGASYEGASHAWYNRSYKVSTTDHYVYHAFTWKAKVKYTWGADTADLNVFFDYDQSVMTGAEGTITQSGNSTRAGFRIAFISDHTVVWAGLQTAANLKAVTAADAGNIVYGADSSALDSNTYSYFASDKYAVGDTNTTSASAQSGYAATKAKDGDPDQKVRADYIGSIVKHASTKTDDSGVSNYIEIWCVAWYEGTDPTIVDANKNDLEKVSSAIRFYSAVDGGVTTP